MWTTYNHKNMIKKLSTNCCVIGIIINTDDYTSIIDLGNFLDVDFVEALNSNIWVTEEEREVCFELFNEFVSNDVFKPYLNDFECVIAENNKIIVSSNSADKNEI